MAVFAMHGSSRDSDLSTSARAPMTCRSSSSSSRFRIQSPVSARAVTTSDLHAILRSTPLAPRRQVSLGSRQRLPFEAVSASSHPSTSAPSTPKAPSPQPRAREWFSSTLQQRTLTPTSLSQSARSARFLQAATSATRNIVSLSPSRITRSESLVSRVMPLATLQLPLPSQTLGTAMPLSPAPSRESETGSSTGPVLPISALPQSILFASLGCPTPIRSISAGATQVVNALPVGTLAGSKTVKSSMPWRTREGSAPTISVPEPLPIPRASSSTYLDAITIVNAKTGLTTAVPRADFPIAQAVSRAAVLGGGIHAAVFSPALSARTSEADNRNGFSDSCKGTSSSVTREARVLGRGAALDPNVTGAREFPSGAIDWHNEKGTLFSKGLDAETPEPEGIAQDLLPLTPEVSPHERQDRHIGVFERSVRAHEEAIRASAECAANTEHLPEVMIVCQSDIERVQEPQPITELRPALQATGDFRFGARQSRLLACQPSQFGRAEQQARRDSVGNLEAEKVETFSTLSTMASATPEQGTVSHPGNASGPAAAEMCLPSLCNASSDPASPPELPTSVEATATARCEIAVQHTLEKSASHINPGSDPKDVASLDKCSHMESELVSPCAVSSATSASSLANSPRRTVSFPHQSYVLGEFREAVPPVLQPGSADSTGDTAPEADDTPAKSVSNGATVSTEAGVSGHWPGRGTIRDGVLTWEYSGDVVNVTCCDTSAICMTLRGREFRGVVLPTGDIMWDDGDCWSTVANESPALAIPTYEHTPDCFCWTTIMSKISRKGIRNQKT